MSVLTYFDPKYPSILKEIHSPPTVLYVQGQLLGDEPAVAIVGSRHASDHGRRMAGRLAEELAERGITVVSGLAHGIDGAAHKGALRAHGRTIAVMGCGLKTVYPRHHKDLAEQIVRSGAILTELSYEVSPQRKNFVPRNRIIAGLSWGTVVVEAASRSGALSTARFAQEENREVFALPGRASDENSLGANRLIKENGAQLITGVDDILEAIKDRFDIHTRLKTLPAKDAETGDSLSENVLKPELDGDETLIYDTLSNEPKHIDDLSRISGLDVGRVSSLLGILELRGLVERLAGTRFRRV